MLLAHCTVRACSRALASTGIKMAISRAMMPMMTRSSTRVNPLRGHACVLRCGGGRSIVAARMGPPGESEVRLDPRNDVSPLDAACNRYSIEITVGKSVDY